VIPSPRDLRGLLDGGIPVQPAGRDETPVQLGSWRGLTPSAESFQHAGVSTSEQTPLQKTIHWLATHTGFPARRLTDRAELLLLISTAAEEADLDARHAQKKPGLQFNPTYNAQLRNYTAQRRRAHITCDNSAKT